jgi:hypothetical protein
VAVNAREKKRTRGINLIEDTMQFLVRILLIITNKSHKKCKNNTCFLMYGLGQNLIGQIYHIFMHSSLSRRNHS